ncbi:MAG: site-specific DNA-methyltransferase [Dehalococcoidia bacterium]
MARKKSTGNRIPVEATKHKDKRVNIPTEELRDFAREDEERPEKLLYPRDPSLDPQLVWKGKDEQDREPLEVPSVPVYIQEKIHPKAIIENVRAQAKKGEPQQEQLALFADFNGLPFEEQIDFYEHEQNWTNRMILGDSLLVMASLAEKEGLKGKVQMIYIDPPYGIKFGSNWQVSTRKRDVRDGRVEDVTRQPEQIRAFRDTWELGIHSYLTYLRDRLTVARDLLTETGSIFVQIGDENVHLVRSLMDEVFGSENFVSLISFRTTSSLGGDYLGKSSDYLIWYSRSLGQLKYRGLYRPRGIEDDVGARFRRVELVDGSRRPMSAAERQNPDALPTGARIYRHDNLTSQSGTEKTRFRVSLDGNAFTPGNGYWKTNEAGMDRLRDAHRLAAPTPKSIAYVRFLEDFPLASHSNVWTDTQTGAFTDPKTYAVQTNTKVIERCVLMTTDPGDLVLDPTCGSGTAAYAAEQWGRRWITIDTSRVALALARTRLMSARYPYYLLADSPEGVRKEAEVTGLTPPDYKTEGDIKKGFVYRRVPHVTLKSIANNPDIKEGMTREAIDAAIARHADTETLYDQPYGDSKRIRVSGPFTVESLSPHRVLSTEEERPESEREAMRSANVGQFEWMILENLRKAGVQNTRKNERLTFERLEPYAGEWLHAEGEYTEKSGLARRVAVSLGPEHGTVGAEQVKEAAKEAMKGAGFDLLIVCGFAFDAHAGETAKEFSPDGEKRDERAGFVAEGTRQYGKLPVLLARMNPDLAMGDELLKKTGAGNLFMVFGEPDVSIEREDGKLLVEIRGLDVYDPTTGQVRSSTTDDIACWFIDTEYNGESFFVRHAYFTGAEEPYDKLKRALRAEVDEAAWSALYSTRSYPFDPPEKGKIAVKVINHYGDEVLKVYEV